MVYLHTCSQFPVVQTYPVTRGAPSCLVELPTHSDCLWLRWTNTLEEAPLTRSAQTNVAPPLGHSHYDKCRNHLGPHIFAISQPFCFAMNLIRTRMTSIGISDYGLGWGGFEMMSISCEC